RRRLQPLPHARPAAQAGSFAPALRGRGPRLRRDRAHLRLPLRRWRRWQRGGRANRTVTLAGRDGHSNRDRLRAGDRADPAAGTDRPRGASGRGGVCAGFAGAVVPRTGTVLLQAPAAATRHTANDAVRRREAFAIRARAFRSPTLALARLISVAGRTVGVCEAGRYHALRCGHGAFCYTGNGHRPSDNAARRRLPVGNWSIERSAELYRLHGWGEPYFDINADGHLSVSPTGADGPRIDLFRLVEELQTRSLSLPYLIRFSDILGDRIRRLNE